MNIERVVMYLDREFHRLLSQGVAYKTSTKMNTVIRSLNSEIVRANTKLSVYNGYYTPGFSMLANAMVRGFTDEFKQADNDVDRLFGSLELQRISITRSFDSSAGGGLPHKRYFTSTKICKEFIFSVSPRNLRTDYPLDKGADGWRHYRPFRLIDIDSPDYTLHITAGLLHHSRNLPRFAIFTFDPVAAILQYTALKGEVSLKQYIHQYLIMPAFTVDNLRLWLLGNYAEWFSARTRSYNDIPMITSDYGRIPLMLDSAMSDIAGIIDSSTISHIGVNRLLSALPLPIATNIPRYATMLYERSSLDNVSEYDWGTFMIYRRMLDVCVRAMKATIASTDTKNHIYALRRAVSLLSRGGILSGIEDSYTKHFVKTATTTLARQVDDLYILAKDT